MRSAGELASLALTARPKQTTGAWMFAFCSSCKKELEMARFHVRTRFASCAFILSLAGLAVVLAGPLDPPAGPVKSSYKTLSEVEPRTVVNAVNTPGNASSLYVISSPGSYYLDRELIGQGSKAGITITAANVTVDLRGFTVRGVAGATTGIVVSVAAGASQVELRNGVLRDWPQAAVRGTTGDITRTNLVSMRVIHAGSSPAIQNLSASWIRDCDIEASTSPGGGVSCDTTQIDRSRVYGTVVASTSSSLHDSTFIAPAGATAVSLTGGGVNIAAKLVNNDINLSGAGTAVRLSGSGHIVEGNRITGPGGLAGTVGIVVAPGSQGMTVRRNHVKGTADNYQLLAGGGNQYDLVLSELPETIDVPSHVTLAGALSMPSGSTAHGVTVNADNVTIDLAGQVLDGGNAGQDGIFVSGFHTGVVIRDGSIRDWGRNGINTSGATSASVERVVVRHCASDGILVGSLTAVRDCESTVNGGAGFVGNVSCQFYRCTAASNTGRGFSVTGRGLLVECTASSNQSDGFWLNYHCEVQHCQANGSFLYGFVAAGPMNRFANCNAAGNTRYGIRAVEKTHISECTLYDNNWGGVHISSGGTVERCTIQYSFSTPTYGILMDGNLVTIRDNTITEYTAINSAGIRIAGGGLCRVEHNHIGNCWRSLDVTSGANMITGNSSVLVGGGGHYAISGGNSFGPIVNISNVGDISAVGNSGHPQANFAY